MSGEAEEEEFLVYVNFDPHNIFHDLDDDQKIKIIGIDEENPIIEINGKIFEGSYDFSIGTNLFFEKDLNPPQLDPLYDRNPKEMYKFIAKTTKVIKTKRIFVEKISKDDDTNDIKVAENLNTLELESDSKKCTYEEALESLALSFRQFDDDDSDNKMNIDNDYTKKVDDDIDDDDDIKNSSGEA